MFDENLKLGINGTYTDSAADYPTIITFGPLYFESYQTWPNTKFIHGFNLGKNSAEDQARTLQSVQYACKALREGKLLYWELGNEPDLFVNRIRPREWNETNYSVEWLNGTRNIREEMTKACPDLATDGLYKYIAPSFAGLINSLDYENTLELIATDDNIGQISGHK